MSSNKEECKKNAWLVLVVAVLNPPRMFNRGWLALNTKLQNKLVTTLKR